MTDDETKRLLTRAFELLLEHQKELYRLSDDVRGLYEFARERDPDSALSLGLQSSEVAKAHSRGPRADKLEQLRQVLQELKR